MGAEFLGRKLFDATLRLVQRSLDIRTARHKVLAGNIAHLRTPGYVFKDLPFRKALERAMENPPAVPVQRTHPAHFLEPSSICEETIAEAEESSAGAERIDREMAKLAENDLMFQASVQALAKKLEALRLAITEGK